MSHDAFRLLKEIGGVKGSLRIFLNGKKLFKNWLMSLTIATLSYIGFMKRDCIPVKCVNGCVDEIPFMAFVRLLYAQDKGVVKSYDCCKGVVEVVNGALVPIEEVANGDVYALIAPLRGWRYDATKGVWLKHGVKFKHMYYFIIEMFDDDAYGVVDCRGRDVVDVDAFVGDSAIYFALRGARRIIALEPHPKAYQELLDNIKLNDLEQKVIPLNAALSSTSSMINVSSEDVDRASIAKSPLKVFTNPRRTRTYNVKAITLSDVVKLYDVSNGVLKMDCEGCEYDVIMHDLEHVALFDELIFEYHANVTGKPIQLLLKILSRYFNCKIVSGNNVQGIVHCVRKS
jgi:FkbM family methyltransferase